MSEREEPRRVRRVLYEDDPREAEYRAMQEEAESIRSDLGRIRGRLQDLGYKETLFWFDSVAFEVRGTLTLCIQGLYELTNGEQSFNACADKSRERWADVEADPGAYVIEKGTSREAHNLTTARHRIQRAAQGDRS